jgi:hypothetical protein
MRRQLGFLFLLVATLGLVITACNASRGSVTAVAPSGTAATDMASRRGQEIEPPSLPTPTDSQAALAPLITTVPTQVPTVTPTPAPSPTLTPTVTPTPVPELRQLTEGGCCTQPFWSPDSFHVLYIDRPNPDEPAGIWAVSVDVPLEPFLYLDRIGLYTDDLRYLVDSDGQITNIERLADPAAGDPGDSWEVPAGGRLISFSPGRNRIAWQVSNDALAVETRVTTIWVANLDGTDPQEVISLPRGGLAGWVSDDVLLLTGRESLVAPEAIFWTYSLADGAIVELVRGERLRGPELSPDGCWLAYYQTFGEAQQDGLWVVSTDGAHRFPLPSDLFGAYQWRDSEHLLIIPFEPDARYHELWQYTTEDQAAQQLTDPAVTPFKIANGDWLVSPDGRRLVFVESSDHNIWLLSLDD